MKLTFIALVGGSVLALLTTTGALGCSGAGPSSGTGQAQQAVLRGKVSSLDKGGGQMVVTTARGSVRVGWKLGGSGATTFRSGGSPASSDDLSDGGEVEVEGSIADCQLEAESVDVSPDQSGSGGAESSDHGSGAEPEDGCSAEDESGDDSGSGGDDSSGGSSDSSSDGSGGDGSGHDGSGGSS
jgi:hypothetical protein